MSGGLCPPDPCCFAFTLLETPPKVFCLRHWCTYVQQGYAFTRIGLWICVDKTQAACYCLVLLAKNLLLSVICCLLFEFKCLQYSLLRPASCTDRAIHTFQKSADDSGSTKYFLLGFNGTTPSRLD